jgi:cyclic 2,3-diphosphoglycerate synthetase
MRVVLIDGEHYVDVNKWAIKKLGNVCCAIFIGGTEKIGDFKEVERKLGVPVYFGENYLRVIEEIVQRYAVEEVVDLSDEPIVNYEDRFRIANLLMKYGVTYRGADFEFKPKKMRKLLNKPSIAIIGTGKRVGKTAISGFVARTLKEVCDLVIITMGRGGPEKPEIVEGDKFEITPEFLLKIAEKGKHASSDHFEDALTSRVLTIGCRRCGGGMAGFSFFDIVEEGVKIANKLDKDLVILEGSGATFPAVKADKYITVVGANQKLEFIRGYFGPFRIGLADLVVVTMAEEPMASEEKVSKVKKAIREINPNAGIHTTIFRPRPLGDIKGKRIALIMTAQKEAVEKVAKYLEETYNVEIVGTSSHLANRPKLREDLKRFKNYDAVLVELKAAAVDVVTKEALNQGKEIVYMDNEPINVDGKDLGKAVIRLWEELKQP